MKDKKRQHYVWKHYLKPWTIDGKIWCKRNGAIFETALVNIGQERFFYKAYKLNDFEENLIKALINKMDPSSHAMNLSTYEIYIEMANGSDYLKKNGIEDYHSFVESNAIEILNSLYQRNMSLLNIKQNKTNFCHFLGMQYTRTKQILNRTTNMFSNLPSMFPEYAGKFDSEKITKVLSLILANIIGNWIYSVGNFFLIENNTQTDFLTGDQPIFNLEMKYLNEGVSPEKFKLYYPLTPKLALLITDEKFSNTSVTDEEVSQYNDFIFNASNDQIYAKQKKLIEYYLNK